MSRTIVYIDGFNLYYRALKGTPHKWLDIEAISRAALPSNCVIERVNYYTAHISGRVDPDAPRRQHAYLRAIAKRSRGSPSTTGIFSSARNGRASYSRRISGL